MTIPFKKTSAIKGIFELKTHLPDRRAMLFYRGKSKNEGEKRLRFYELINQFMPIAALIAGIAALKASCAV